MLHFTQISPKGATRQIGEICEKILIYTGWSKKRHKVYGTIILQPYITESCDFQQNVLKKILHMVKVSV